MSGLVYIGKIIDMQPITGADYIVSATVVCGPGGKWRGIIRKADFEVGNHCVVYLPDAQIPENDKMQFMAATHWRVKMRRFKGVPSEVVIMPYNGLGETSIGDDVTEVMGVTKYHKPVPAHLQGNAKGAFPNFVPKTDEPNYQREPDLIAALIGKPYYITEKCDGSSTTAYRYLGQFGLCSRNLELQRNEANGYWQVAIKYKLEENLPEGYALQWETCGPGIQSNPMGLKEIDGFVFSGYKIDEHRYLEMTELWALCDRLKFPMCKIIKIGSLFEDEDMESLGEGLYANGAQREGAVVRSQDNVANGKPISFKVINLNYER